MDRTSISSSNLAAVGWEVDEDGVGILEVEFNSGAVYQYVGVSRETYEGLLFAPSPGRYLITNIIDAYDGQRIE